MTEPEPESGAPCSLYFEIPGLTVRAEGSSVEDTEHLFAVACLAYERYARRHRMTSPSAHVQSVDAPEPTFGLTT